MGLVTCHFKEWCLRSLRWSFWALFGSFPNQESVSYFSMDSTNTSSMPLFQHFNAQWCRDLIIYWSVALKPLIYFILHVYISMKNLCIVGTFIKGKCVEHSWAQSQWQICIINKWKHLKMHLCYNVKGRKKLPTASQITLRIVVVPSISCVFLIIGLQ